MATTKTTPQTTSNQQQLFDPQRFFAFPFHPWYEERPSDALYQRPWDGKECSDDDGDVPTRRTNQSHK